MTALVSVVVPAFNAARWIGETLASVTAQTWTNLEIIVVDDGSVDKTADVVAAFADPRLRLVRHDHHGAAAARNRGILESRGELIQFLDADDVLSHDKIERQARALQSALSDSLASCAWARFSKTPDALRVEAEQVWAIADPVEWLVKSLAGGGMMQPGAWLTPRVLIDAAGPWNENLSLHDDGEFFCRVLLRAKRNIFVHEAIVYYRDVNESLSRRRGRAAIESALAVCRLRANHLLAVRDDRNSRRALATQYAQFAYEFASVAPDLTAEALAAIHELGEKPAGNIGGKLFRLSAALLGLDAAVRLRSRQAAT